MERCVADSNGVNSAFFSLCVADSNGVNSAFFHCAAEQTYAAGSNGLNPAFCLLYGVIKSHSKHVDCRMAHLHRQVFWSPAISACFNMKSNMIPFYNLAVCFNLIHLVGMHHENHMCSMQVDCKC